MTPKLTEWEARGPWNRPDHGYGTIDRVRYDAERGRLTVWFEDGSAPEFDPAPLIPRDLEEVDWWRSVANEIEVVVPRETGWFEIPWDVMRRHTDAAFRAVWQERWAEMDSKRSLAHSVRDDPG